MNIVLVVVLGLAMLTSVVGIAIAIGTVAGQQQWPPLIAPLICFPIGYGATYLYITLLFAQYG